MALPLLKHTEYEYAESERIAPYRSQFVDGEIFAMAGGNQRHSELKVASVRCLGELAWPRGCKVFDSDLRVRAGQMQTYPDASVVCGAPLHWGDQADCLVNPVLLVEVLSESTAAFDRGKKFAYYKQIESLREYMLVWQTRHRVEVYRKSAAGEWIREIADGLDAVIRIHSLDGDLRLTDLYRGIETPAEIDW